MQQRGQVTRARLLDAAWSAFAAHGFDAASVDEICRRAGVSKGAFYHHFDSKQSIFLALLQEWLDGIYRSLEASRGKDLQQTFSEMSALLPGLFSHANEHLALFLEFWAQARRDPQVWEATIAPYRRFQAFFDDLLKQGIAEGSIAPHETQRMSRVLLALAVGLLLQGALEPEEENWQLTAMEGLAALARGLQEKGDTQA